MFPSFLAQVCFIEGVGLIGPGRAGIFVNLVPVFAAIMAVPFWDVDAAVAEIERCAGLGHRGILFTASPQDFGLPYLADRHWDRFWAAAQASGLPISFHIGSGDFGDFSADRVESTGPGATNAVTAVNLFLDNGKQLVDLLFSGVLPRYPELELVSVESGIGWMAGSSSKPRTTPSSTHASGTRSRSSP